MQFAIRKCDAPTFVFLQTVLAVWGLLWVSLCLSGSSPSLNSRGQLCGQSILGWHL